MPKTSFSFNFISELTDNIQTKIIAMRRGWRIGASDPHATKHVSARVQGGKRRTRRPRTSLYRGWRALTRLCCLSINLPFLPCTAHADVTRTSVNKNIAKVAARAHCEHPIPLASIAAAMRALVVLRASQGSGPPPGDAMDAA